MDYSKKNHEKLVGELNDLKMKYDALKSSYEKDIPARIMAEEKILKRTSIISAFNKYSIELEEQDEEIISKFVVNSFKKLFGVRAVWISRYSEETQELIIESSTATEEEKSKIMRYLRLPLQNYRISLNDEKLEIILSIRTKMFSSLHEISFGQIPENIGKSLERIFDVGWFMGIALIEKGKLYGTIGIAAYKGQEELDPDIVKIFSDLTSTVLRRKEAERRLITSEEKFRKAFITSPDSININRLTDGMYVSINNGFTKMTGYTEADVIGKTSIELNIWVDLSTREKLVKALLENTDIQHIETSFRKKDGSILYGIMSATVIELDGDKHLLTITRDITFRKQAEMSLKENARLLMETQIIARLGSFVWDLTSGMWKSSSILDEIFGIDKNFIRSFEGWVSLIHPDYKKVMIDYVTNDILAKHHKFDKEYLIIRPDNGHIRWVHGISELEFDESGKPSKLIGTIIDITDRKNADEEIKKLNVSLEERVIERTAQLEAANSELQAFAYSVSHDLRAPLRAIDGFSKFVIEDYGTKLDTEGRRLLGLIRSNTKKMDKLITDILALSRVARGEHKKSKIDMTRMAVSMFNEAASAEMLEKLDFIIDDLPDTYADPTYIKQVWINLISNAIKFSSLKSRPEIKIGGYSDNGYNVYYVKDNGAGFNPEYAHKLFGVFQRLHRANEFEGTGVGLAIVQRIIHKHGGKVWADGKEDRGATFYFSLPVSR